MGEREIEYPPQRVEALEKAHNAIRVQNRTLDLIALSMTPTGFVL